MKLDIAGVSVDNITKRETLEKISEFVKSEKPHLIVTTYSEFVVEANKNEKYKQVINNAALSLPDGIGIIWAAKYLSLPLGSFKKLSALCQVVYSGASLIFNPAYCRTVIKEQVTGSRLIWDIAELATKNNYTLALVGGWDNVAVTTSEKLKEKFPSLKVNLAVSPRAFDDKLVSTIAVSNSDILLIAYQPPKQEFWLADNLQKLNIKVGLGLGGTFDYIAGIRPPAPNFIHYMGLEWLWRLITQPWRIKRIWRAIVVFITVVYKYKLNKINS